MRVACSGGREAHRRISARASDNAALLIPRFPKSLMSGFEQGNHSARRPVVRLEEVDPALRGALHRWILTDASFPSLEMATRRVSL